MVKPKVVELRQCDFECGPVTITQGDTIYRLCEDIVFDPKVAPWKANPYNPLNATCPVKTLESANDKEEIANTCPKDRTNFKLGFPAAIIILCDGVTIDMNGHSLEMSKKFHLLQRFYSHIQIGASPFETGKGPAPTFDTFDMFPTDIVITSKCGRGVLGLTSHTSIMVIGNNSNTVDVSNIDFVNNEVSAGIFNLCGDVKVSCCTLDNCNLVVPVNSIFSGLVQGSSKLEKIVKVFEQWFIRLTRENVDAPDDEPAPMHDLGDLYQDAKLCTKEIKCLSERLRKTEKCDREHVQEKLDHAVEHLLNIQRKIGIQIYFDNFPTDYPVDVTWPGASDATKMANDQLPYKDNVVESVEVYKMLLKVKASLDDMICATCENVHCNNYKGLTDPTLHEFFNPTGEPDGSAYYGLSFVNSSTPGVNDFAKVDEESRNGNVCVDNFKMRNVKLSPLEIPGIDYKGEVNNDETSSNDVSVISNAGYTVTNTLKTMVGEIFYLRDACRCSPYFAAIVNMADAFRRQNTVYTDNEQEDNGLNFPNLDGLTGTMMIDDMELIDYMRQIIHQQNSNGLPYCLPSFCEILDSIRCGIKTLKKSSLIGDVGSGSRYTISLDQDIMQHKPKGIFGMKIEGVKTYTLCDVHINNVRNTGLDYNRGLGGVSTFNPDNEKYHYGGVDITGMVAASSGNVTDCDDSLAHDLKLSTAEICQKGAHPNRYRMVNGKVQSVFRCSDDAGCYVEECKYGYKPKKCTPPCDNPCGYSSDDKCGGCKSKNQKEKRCCGKREYDSKSCESSKSCDESYKKPCHTPCKPCAPTEAKDCHGQHIRLGYARPRTDECDKVCQPKRRKSSHRRRKSHRSRHCERKCDDRELARSLVKCLDDPCQSSDLITSLLD